MMNHTTFVNYENNCFTVYSLGTGECKTISTNYLIGGFFKYLSDFSRYFKSIYPNQKRIVYSSPAWEEVNILMEFNRVDS